MYKWHCTETHTQHRHFVHFNCHVIWSNSKWTCDLSIDSFFPRLWIKCFNYWCTDVRCLLECCMWCRPLSPGKLLPPPYSQPNSTPTTTATTPPPTDTVMHPLDNDSTWHEWNLNTLQAACRQASTNWGKVITKIKSVFLHLSPHPCIYCNPPH